MADENKTFEIKNIQENEAILSQSSGEVNPVLQPDYAKHQFEHDGLGADKIMWNDILTSTKIQKTTVNLSSAQILALNATPVTLVSATAGKIIIVDNITFIMTRTATAYANGGNVTAMYDDNYSCIAPIDDSVVTGAAGITICNRPGVQVDDWVSTDIIGQPIKITNTTAPFITGTGTAQVIVTYYLI